MEKTDSDKFIVELNYTNKFIDEQRVDNEVSTRKMIKLLPETVADRRTLELAEIHDLFKAVDHTTTFVGATRLFRSLVNPSANIELIQAKQDAFCELESNEPLQAAIEEFLAEFHKGEADLFRLLNVHLHPLTTYEAYKQAMRTIERLLVAVRRIPQPETVYLDSLFKSILSFNGSPVRQIVAGRAYRTLRGMKARQEKGLLTPSWRFRPSRLSFGSVLPAVPGLSFGAAWLFGWMAPAVAQALCLTTSWLSLAGLAYGVVLKPMADFETAVLPIRQRLLDSNRFATAIEAVAAVDELLSFVRFSAAMPHPTTMPEITNEESHFFVARNLRNPVGASRDPDFVANDVNLSRERLLFITGPNSGGKTTFCKTIVQSQILGQIGAPVVASAAMINMADTITYQAPAFDTLSDPEGRFGTELKVTRDVFYAATPKSLVILDEIAEGTTTREKISLSVDVMKGFHAIGSNTLLVTHSHELVEHFRDLGLGQYLQVEFSGSAPTHRMIAGISTDSHALRVARKIGFAPEDIQRHLEEQGYL